eukprot:5023460-Karenia_brevis.AAC.1
MYGNVSLGAWRKYRCDNKYGDSGETRNCRSLLGPEIKLPRRVVMPERHAAVQIDVGKGRF